jgi:hypothetical protein
MKVSILLAFYGGPDQLMPLTSGLTAVFALLLIFWNKVLGIIGKIINVFRGSNLSAVSESSTKPAAQENVERSQPGINS